MTHDQHNEAPNLLHVSDIFLCHSTCKPSNLRFSSLPAFLNEFVNILFSFPLFLAICFPLRISPLHDRLVTPSVSNHSGHPEIIPPPSNIGFCTIHSFIVHAFKFRLFLFFFTLKHATTPFPLPKPIFILHLNLSLFLCCPLAVQSHLRAENFSEPSAN